MNSDTHTPITPITLAGLTCGCPSCSDDDERQDAANEFEVSCSHISGLTGGTGIIVAVNGQQHIVAVDGNRMTVIKVSESTPPLMVNGTPLFNYEPVDLHGQLSQEWIGNAIVQARNEHDREALMWII